MRGHLSSWETTALRVMPTLLSYSPNFPRVEIRLYKMEKRFIILK